MAFQPSYYPSMVAHLKLSFDERLTLTVPPSQLNMSAQSVEDALRAPAQLAPGVEPLVTSSSDSSYVLNRVPKKGSVMMPSTRIASTFDLTFVYRDLPIDPRTVRAAAVEVYLGTVTAKDFREGMRGGRDAKSVKSILSTGGLFGTNANTRDPAIVGIVDVWKVTHSGDDSIVNISGRDLRGVLIDTPISANPKEADQVMDSLDLTQPIDVVIRDLLKSSPIAQHMSVSTNPGEWQAVRAGPVPSPGGGALARVRKGAKGKKTGGRASTGGSTQANTSFWGLVVRLCYLVGAVPHFVGTDLRIRPARNLYDQRRAGFEPGIATPFAGGLVRGFDADSETPMPSPLSIRRMVYGRDIDEITFERRYGGYFRPRQIRVIGVDANDPKRGIIEGIWPDNLTANRVFAGGMKSMADIVYIPIADIVDVDRLTEIARAVFEESARGEMGGSCDTKRLSSFGGDNDDPDLLRLKPGDAIEFGVDVRAKTRSSPLSSVLTDQMREPFEKQVQAITALNGDENLSRVILGTARGTIRELQSFFCVSRVSYDWGNDGLAVSFDFLNFVEAQGESTAVPATPPTRKSVPETKK